MNIIKAFSEAFSRAKFKGWDYIVVLVDIHGTIIKPCWDEEETFDYYQGAKDTLRVMSKREDIKMVLWSSCYPEKLKMYNDKFESDGIHFDYINEFTDAENSSTGCFNQKMFFNVGLDNAFGFEPERDWGIVLNYLKE